MVANNWLNNVVSKNYGIAYFDYSQQVKENSDSTYWIQAVDQLMKEFGTFKKREIIKSEFKNNPALIKRSIELLNQGLPVNEAANILEKEKLIKLNSYPRPSDGKLIKAYDGIRKFFNKQN